MPRLGADECLKLYDRMFPGMIPEEERSRFRAIWNVLAADVNYQARVNEIVWGLAVPDSDPRIEEYEAAKTRARETGSLDSGKRNA